MILSRNKSTRFVISSYLITSHLITSHLISSHLISSILIYYHILSSPFLSSNLIYFSLICSHLLSSMLWCISPAVIIKVSAFIPSIKDFIWEIKIFWILWVTFSCKNYKKNSAYSSNNWIIEKNAIAWTWWLM